MFTILFSALFGVSPPWFRCLIHLFLLCFTTSTLLLLTCLFSCARYTEKAFMLCVPLYLWDTILAFSATYLVSSLCALLAFLYALLVLYCLAGALCGCVRYTPLVIYFHIGAFMLMSDALISDLFPLLVLAAWIWVSFLFSCFYYGSLSILYLSHPIYLFQHFTAYLGLGLCVGSPH